MSQNIHPEDILFIDIETVPAFPSLAEAPALEQVLWEKKSHQLAGKTNEVKVDYQRAGIYAEFGKIICISCGRLSPGKEGVKLSITTFASNSEIGLLKNLSEFLHHQKKHSVLCAHNGKEFDYPYLSRRFLINRLSIPEILHITGKKPWEIKHLDTLELWKFGDYKHYTSLEVLAHVFGIPSPKSDFDGSRVAQVYYEQHDLKSIRNYCENDIRTLVMVYLHQTNQLQWIPEHVEVERIN